MPYVGAGVLASAIGMDKVAMKDMFRAHGLPIVDYLVVRRHEWRREPDAVEPAVAPTRIGFPCFVKPANLGSSVGHQQGQGAGGPARRARRWPRATTAASWSSARVQGREVEVAVLGNDAPAGLAARRGLLRRRVVRLRDEVRRGPDHLQGARAALSPETTARVRALAVEAFQAIDCAGMARVDFFIEGDDRVLVNEINTIPGFTATSAYPRLWEASGSPTPT